MLWKIVEEMEVGLYFVNNFLIENMEIYVLSEVLVVIDGILDLKYIVMFIILGFIFFFVFN